VAIQVFDPGLQYYVDMINAGQPFTFIRYGDGEWSAILGDRARTSSGSQALRVPELKDAMSQSIKRAWQADNYFPALRPTSFNKSPAIANWLRANTPAWVKWHKCTVFYLASRKGRLHPFIEALRNLKMPIVVVGPQRLRALNDRAFPIAHFIEIPGKDCWIEKRKILDRCVAIKEPALFTFTAGPAAKPMAWKLFNHVGKHSFILDVGSLLDIYVGSHTRRYHHSMTKAIIRANLMGMK